MASLITSFKYIPEMSLVIGKDEYVIPEGSIQNIITDYNYDKNNMPIIYLNLKISSFLYNKMVLNTDKAVISFRLFKYNDSSTSTIRTLYFEDRFIYVMSSDPNYEHSIQSLASSRTVGIDTNPDTYLQGYVGLLSLKCINNNKMLINAVVKNVNLLSIIHKYTSHMNMCIEPLDNNDIINQFIIPPITSISSLLEYLNSYFCLYKSGYRFFRDFATTYLLSMNGNAVTEISNKFNTIIISIRDPADDLSKVNSMELDNTNHAYIIYVNASDTSIKIDKTSDKKFTSIMGVDTLGDNIQEDLSLPASPDSTEKLIVERVSEGNLDLIYNTKKAIESSTVTVVINKTEIDASILSPNKAYYIRNVQSNTQYDGKYVLSYKKEIMLIQDTAYIGSVSFGLRKIE